MLQSRRQFLLESLAAASLIGCRKPSSSIHVVLVDDTLSMADFERTVESPVLSKAADYLVSKQQRDGTWRSDLHGMFKFGDALTPLCLQALLVSAPQRREPIAKAAAWLAAFAKPDGKIEEPEFGFEFAAYIAALAVITLSHPKCPKHDSARQAWLKYLRQRQLTEELGWTTDDPQYGGWGYCRVVPRKHQPGDLLTPPLLESNLSATTYALAALKATGVPDSDPAYKKALVFVKRNQNWTDDAKKRDLRFDDGGFFFIYDDAVRNKAGIAGQDSDGRDRYHSYGSMTVDGLRCLDMCGQTASPRRKAAAEWLRQRFQPKLHPGRYAERRENDREATYFYYAASLAQSEHESWNINGNEEGPTRRAALAEAIRGMQQPDGSWVNRVGLVREDEPLVATSFAMIALANLS
jgi:squalene-hopene/tetraprenyl-beta-curcumene cyclase